MVDKFRTKHEKKILCCIVDNHDLCQSGYAKEISINLTDWLIHRFHLNRFDIYIDKDENKLLADAVNDNFYTHAVVMASGTSLGLSDRLFKSIEEMCNQDFFIAGHILDRKEKYYELHHQFYIVNLEEFKQLNCPVIDKGDHFTKDIHTTIEPERSAGCLYNDTEIPEWTKNGTTLKTYTHKLHGWNIIKLALENNKTIIDCGSGIRSSKTYFYYEYDHVFIREVSKLFYNNFFCHVFFAPWNSDTLADYIRIDKPVEQYVTVGIGLNWIKNLQKLNYSPQTKVIFTDINYHCLQFMKDLVTTWDGNDYAEFYKNNLGFQINNSFVNFDTLLKNTRDEWNNFKASFDDWPSVWEDIKKLTFEFVVIDYTSEYDLSWIEKDKSTFINISDLFNHAPFMYGLNVKYRVHSENKLLQKLNSIDPNIMLLTTSRAAIGFYDSKVTYDKVSNYDQTTIDLLKKPVWHTDDWKSFSYNLG